MLGFGETVLGLAGFAFAWGNLWLASKERREQRIVKQVGDQQKASPLALVVTAHSACMMEPHSFSDAQLGRSLLESKKAYYATPYPKDRAYKTLHEELEAEAKRRGWEF